MWSNPQEAGDLDTFTEELLNGKLHFFVQWLKRIQQTSKIQKQTEAAIHWCS